MRGGLSRQGGAATTRFTTPEARDEVWGSARWRTTSLHCHLMLGACRLALARSNLVGLLQFGHNTVRAVFP